MLPHGLSPGEPPKGPSGTTVQDVRARSPASWHTIVACMPSSLREQTTPIILEAR